ncbi:MAG TPA: hypothetical protein DCW68_03325 [Rhodospirillaceae bacterium]|nr:MAG: hypothetical protein A2018_06300 [Alphaproteobacteria bacterium GWF2_58_20]HAU29124.1 hypothetical protein [Rhodospirillaceae bacterium]
MRKYSVIFLVLAVAFQLMGPLAVFVPRCFPLLVGFISIAGIMVEIQKGNGRSLLRLNRIQGSLMLFWIVALASSLWSLDGEQTLVRALRLFFFVLPILALPHMVRRLSLPEKERLWSIFAGSWAGGVVLMVGENLFDHPVYRMGKGIAEGVALDDVVTNHPLIVLSVLLWPVAMHLFAKGPKWIGAVLPLVATILLFPLTSQSATLAMGVASCALLIGLCSPKAIRRLWLAISLLGCVAVVPLAMLPYTWGWADSSWLMDSARHRVEIWYYTACTVLQRPFLGHGLESSSLLLGDGGPWHFLKTQGPIMSHPHNMFLQVWFETGAVGAFFILLFFVSLYRNLRRTDLVRQPYVWSGLFFVVTAASAGFGAWQGWWLAAICFMAFFFMMEKEDGKQT